MSSHLDHLLAHCPPRSELGADDRAASEALLAEILDRCADAWPTVVFAPAEFAAYIGARLSPDLPLLQALRELHDEELYLTFAIARGDRGALPLLQTRYGPHIEAVLSSFGPDAAARDDLRQAVLDRLFVAREGKPPHIASYSGAGSLAAWLRVTSKRVALNATRRRDPLRNSAPSDEVMKIPAALRDPELDHLELTYQSAFREAFAEAAVMLTPRQRTLLKHSIVRGLNVRQIGRMYDVHHATAARWIGAARQDLIEHTRSQLAARLSVSPDELQSMMLAIQSRLDVTVSRIFRDA